ncbi:MAG TPA: RNA polymerase sigma factor [Rhizomicrobium sp.]|nr:RNA polymerase sigma factor [Rhizomicrobium sp.]
MSLDQDSFRALYQANRERVRQVIARMAGPQEADDLTQVVFAKAAAGLESFRGDASASTWLYRIAANVAADFLRSRAARDAKATLALPDDARQEGVDTAPSPEQALSRKDAADCLRAEVAKVSESCRDVLLLSMFGGLAEDEIAAALEITPANAKVRLHRGRQELKKAIGERCDFYRTEFSCAPSSPDCCQPGTVSRPKPQA